MVYAKKGLGLLADNKVNMSKSCDLQKQKQKQKTSKPTNQPTTTPKKPKKPPNLLRPDQ